MRRALRHAEACAGTGFFPSIGRHRSPQDATGGRAIVATGSPFPDAFFEGRKMKSSQGNNVYIFPGLALGAVLGKTPIITDDMFMAASEALVDVIAEERLQAGQCFPDLNNPREIAAAVALGAAGVSGLVASPASAICERQSRQASLASAWWSVSAANSGGQLRM